MRRSTPCPAWTVLRASSPHVKRIPPGPPCRSWRFRKSASFGIAAPPASLPTPWPAALGLGQDGTRDYWSPYGDGDMLGRTWQLAFVNQLRRDDLIERCVAVATVGGRAVVDPGAACAHWSAVGARGVAVGEPADLVLLPGETVTSAVMDRPPQRIVIHRGRVVAENGAVV